MYRYETHLHTAPVSRCASAGVRETLEYYKELGYEGVFITNHFLDGNINIDKEKYSIVLKYHNGISAFEKEVHLDVFQDDESASWWLCDKHGDYYVRVEFTPTDAIWDNKRMSYVIPADSLKLKYSDDSDCEEAVEAAKQTEPECLIIRRHHDNGIHYKMAK